MMKPNFRRVGRRLSSFVQGNRWLQAAGLALICTGTNAVARASGWPVPGSVIGLFLVLALLLSGALSADWFRRGAHGLLDHLMLFFVPAMLGLVDHRELIGALGCKLLLVVLVGTLLVMVGTALVVEVGFRFKARHAN